MDNSYNPAGYESYTKMGFDGLVNLIFEAKKRLFYASPSIHPEIASAFEARAGGAVDIRIVIDPSEKNFRHGYGQIDAVEKLREAGIILYEYPDNLVSFIISDDTAYYIFHQSRMFEEEGTTLNAVRLSTIEILKIISSFFPPQSY